MAAPRRVASPCPRSQLTWRSTSAHRLLPHLLLCRSSVYLCPSRTGRHETMPLKGGAGLSFRHVSSGGTSACIERS